MVGEGAIGNRDQNRFVGFVRRCHRRGQGRGISVGHENSHATAQFCRIGHGIEALELAHRTAPCFGHVLECFAEAQDHRLQALVALGLDRCLGEKRGRAERNPQGDRRAVGRKAAGNVLGIEILDDVGTGASGPGQRHEGNAGGNFDPVELPRWIHGEPAEAKVLQVVAHDGGGQNLGHVERGFPGKAGLMTSQLPEVVGVEACDGSQDGAIAGVVGPERQRPAAEAHEEILEHARRGLGGTFRIAASVDPVADFEPIGASCPGNELPNAARALVRCRSRIETAFDHRQENEILGQALLVELALDDGAVAAHPAQPCRHGRTTSGVVLEELQVADDLRFPAYWQVGQR